MMHHLWILPLLSFQPHFTWPCLNKVKTGPRLPLFDYRITFVMFFFFNCIYNLQNILNKKKVLVLDVKGHNEFSSYFFEILNI